MVILSTSTAFGQQEAGDIEFIGSLQYYTTVGTDYDSSSGSIRAKIGLFLSDSLELGVSPRIRISKTSGYDGDSETETTIGTGFFGMYSFLMGDSTIVPYVGGQVEINDIEEVGDTMSAGVGGGVKFYFSEKAFVDFNGNYGFPLWEDAEGGVLTLYAGLGYLFRFGD